MSHKMVSLVQQMCVLENLNPTQWGKAKLELELALAGEGKFLCKKCHSALYRRIQKFRAGRSHKPGRDSRWNPGGVGKEDRRRSTEGTTPKLSPTVALSELRAQAERAAAATDSPLAPGAAADLLEPDLLEPDLLEPDLPEPDLLEPDVLVSSPAAFEDLEGKESVAKFAEADAEAEAEAEAEDASDAEEEEADPEREARILEAVVRASEERFVGLPVPELKRLCINKQLDPKGSRAALVRALGEYTREVCTFYENVPRRKARVPEASV